MNVLADQGFPDSVRLNSTSTLKIWRWSNEVHSDAELLQLAANEGFGAVLMLGTTPLYTPDLTELASELRLALIGTHDTEPIGASIAVGANASALERMVAPGARVLVLARELRLL